MLRAIAFKAAVQPNSARQCRSQCLHSAYVRAQCVTARVLSCSGSLPPLVAQPQPVVAGRRREPAAVPIQLQYSSGLRTTRSTVLHYPVDGEMLYGAAVWLDGSK